MKKVYVTVPETDPPSSYKFKVASTTKGSNFKEYVAREVVSLIDVEFFFIKLEKGKEWELLDETKPFSAISEGKRIRLRLIQRNQSVNIRTSFNDIKTFNFDIKDTIGSNINKMNLENPELFVLSFKRKNEIFPRVCSNSLPLIIHKWNGEQLTLHRRILPNEFSNSTPENIRFLYGCCQLQINDNVVFFSKKNWGIAAGYNYLLEDKKDDEIRKTSFIKYLPSVISFTDNILIAAKDIITKNSTLTPQKSAEKYVEHFGQSAVSCCHSEQIKFLLIDDKWHMQSTRIIHVSLNKIVITKSIDDDVLIYELISDIVSVDIEGEHLMIKYKNGISWKIKSEMTTILYNCIKDVIKLNNELDPQATQVITRSIDDLPGLILDRDISTASMSSGVLPKDTSESSDLEEDSQDSSDDDCIVIQSSIYRSKSNLNDYVPGISSIVPPSPHEDPVAPYSIDHQLYRDLKIVKTLSIPELKFKYAMDGVPDLATLIGSETNDAVVKTHYLKYTFIAICITFILIIIKNS
ncbi:hypothetical protein TVAG_178570 [Trichomonas vaginalis G3]|uniref:Uncharacterized protein n=1 Tax=Trichomonas vaginalis (strain ATCC PRA-98 / G3) TaxID=412133 RepID=A2DIK9_TRIV3|nr:hypothetical protein TVAGG3_0602610 [Trichomonas vaginalis G3]EAY19813.1 hypothetical protein TVAG_178570 [Trichomonas vaginalis G3]KAI5524016.1 hypothetical protein TVAGG3_0602610 [Trichomonas vaginalis G3]|eukprot:XP_001580799.1 hypothetical protein [Trichomonas vaginalis G3]